jgi:hypothetical protein
MLSIQGVNAGSVSEMFAALAANPGLCLSNRADEQRACILSEARELGDLMAEIEGGGPVPDERLARVLCDQPREGIRIYSLLGGRSWFRLQRDPNGMVFWIVGPIRPPIAGPNPREHSA